MSNTTLSDGINDLTVQRGKKIYPQENKQKVKRSAFNFEYVSKLLIYLVYKKNLFIYSYKKKLFMKM